MKSISTKFALIAVIALPAAFPMVTANAADVDTVPASVNTSIQTVTVSGSAGVNL